MKAVIPGDGLDARWIAWGFRAFESELLSGARKAGTTVASLEMSRFYDFTLPVPPLDEQRRIADILEDHLSRLDAADRNLDRAARRSGALSQTLLDALVPAEAPMIRLGTLAQSSGYGTSAKCVVDGRGSAVVRIPNLRRGRIDLSDEKRVEDSSVDVSKLKLAPGDLLVVRTNGSKDLIGRTAVVQEDVDASFASYLIRFRFDPSRIHPRWAHLMLGRQFARRQLEALAASSAGQYNLSLAKLTELEIPVPSIREQREVLGTMDDQGSSTDRIVGAIQQSRVRIYALRRALLAAAFSGKLTGHASDVDRIEEMAS
jgi:type I restriction enzyme, S subunit